MAYEDLNYREALAVLEGEIHIIDPNLIFAARKKAKKALKIMIEKEEETVAQTSGRYSYIDSKHAAGALFSMYKLKNSIDFLQGWDTTMEFDLLPPELMMTHNQYEFLVRRAAKTLEAVLLYGGTRDEIERATKFALIALDAEKHCIDIYTAQKVYGFKELEDKYARGIQE